MRKKIYAIILVFILCFNLCGCEKIVTDIKKLEKINKKEDIRNFWFPQEIKKETVESFTVQLILGGVTQYCLELKYDKEEFDKELARLNEAVYSCSAYKKYGVLFYDDNGKLFELPTYIYCYHSGHVYQFISIDVEQRIIAYIFTFQYTKEEIVFNIKYLPKNFEINNYEETKDGYAGGVTYHMNQELIDEWNEILL